MSLASDKAVRRNRPSCGRTHAAGRSRGLRTGIRSQILDANRRTGPSTRRNHEEMHILRSFLRGRAGQVAPGPAPLVPCASPAFQPSLTAVPDAATHCIATGRNGAARRTTPNQWTEKWRLKADVNRTFVVAAGPNGNISTLLYSQARCGLGALLQVNSTPADSVGPSAKTNARRLLSEDFSHAVEAHPGSAMSYFKIPGKQRLTALSGHAATTGQGHH